MGDALEKRLQDKRSRVTEESFVTALLTVDEIPSVNWLTSAVGISRSTFYRHYRTVNEIIPSYENYILSKYSKIIESLLEVKSVTLSDLFSQVLMFMHKHQQIFQLLSIYGSYNLAEQIIVLLKDKILSASKITNDIIFIIYAKEASALIEQWQKNGFETSQIPTVVKKMVHLANIAHIHLRFVV